MDTVFQLVVIFLSWLSEITGLSYKAINIVVYFIITPFIFFFLIDKLIKRHYLKIGFLAIVFVSLLIIRDFEAFSGGLFDLSVRFLKWFNVIGWNYTVASVIICVVIPVIAFLVLFYFAYREKIKKLIEKL